MYTREKKTSQERTKEIDPFELRTGGFFWSAEIRGGNVPNQKWFSSIPELIPKKSENRCSNCFTFWKDRTLFSRRKVVFVLFCFVSFAHSFLRQWLQIAIQPGTMLCFRTKRTLTRPDCLIIRSSTYVASLLPFVSWAFFYSVYQTVAIIDHR